MSLQSLCRILLGLSCGPCAEVECAHQPPRQLDSFPARACLTPKSKARILRVRAGGLAALCWSIKRKRVLLGSGGSRNEAALIASPEFLICRLGHDVQTLRGVTRVVL